MQMSPDCWIATTKSTDADPQNNRESNDDPIPHGPARYAFCARTGPPRQTRSGKKKFAISTQNYALASPADGNRFDRCHMVGPRLVTGTMQVVRGRDEGQNSPRWEIALVTVKKLVSWDGF